MTALAIVALGVALGMVAASVVFSALRANPLDNDPLQLTDADRMPGDVDPWLQSMAKRALDPAQHSQENTVA
jgi:hypothetical protein